MRVKRIIPLFVVLVLALVGCKTEYKPETVSGYIADVSTIILNQDGSIEGFICDQFDTSTYSVDKLKSSIEAEIEDFSKSSPDQVSLSLCEMKDGKINIQMHYTNAKAYSDYNGVILFHGTVNEAVTQGFDFDKLMLVNASGFEYAGTDLLKDSDKNVLISADGSNLRVLSGMEYCDSLDRMLNDYEVDVDPSHELHCVVLK